ncbi:hypothetical protein [Flammeovirga aprica]|uniref:Uncharacterized protein n=1 Tax=Flammeovirga aprica JL-4 TaxID=694437 RepID=A0A7X9RYV0_9BACT|nr:hypothetical protein [Flammeovirga aprica]NME71265.1 hypothetical protein [Flammeovirga aprica JL-4]
MNDLEVANFIINKFKRRYGDKELKTHNDRLNTFILRDLETVIDESLVSSTFEIAQEEIPLLFCELPNQNKILMTTRCMYSLYKKKFYKLLYSKYSFSDRSYYRKTIQLVSGKTVTFKYCSIDNEDFFYEIDSFYPADAAHYVVCHEMVLNKFF